MDTRRRKRGRTVSLQKSLILRLFFVLLVAIIVYQFVFYLTDSVWKLQRYGYEILENQSIKKAAELSGHLESVMAQTEAFASRAEGIVGNILSDGRDFSSLEGADGDLDILYAAILGAALAELDSGFADGVFLFLDAAYSDMPEELMSGLFLRSENDGRVLFRGDERFAEGESPAVTLGADWKRYEEYNSAGVYPEYIEYALKSGREGKGQDRGKLGWLSWVTRLSPEGGRVVTYSLPLFGPDGAVIGVCGFEIKGSVLQRLISGKSMPFDTGFYMMLHESAIIRSKDNSEIHADFVIFSSDFAHDIIFGKAVSVPVGHLRSFNDRNIYSLKTIDGSRKFVVLPEDINIYGEGAYYGAQRYVLCGLVTEDEIFSAIRDLNFINYLLMGVTFALIAAGLVFIGVNLSRKIKKLTVQITRSGTTGELAIKRSYVTELDELAQAFLNMNASLLKSAEKTAAILELVGTPIGIFEHDLEGGRVMITRSLCRMLGGGEGAGSALYFSADDFADTYALFKDPEELFGPEIKPGDIAEDEYETRLGERFLKVSSRLEDMMVYSVVIDITREVNEKNLLEFERDYDPLTKLLNRASYKKKIAEKIAAAPREAGVFMFCDLDNLKTINDAYGHGAGDMYIQSSAEAFREFEHYGCVLARISGDEFVIYLHGGTKESLLSTVNKVIYNVKKKSANIPEAPGETIKVSIGLAFYPSDSSDIDTLSKYADFAMYEIKHASRGGIRSFSRESFDRDTGAARSQNFIDIFIEHKRLKFAFQPVLSAKNCELYGYEVLLRPQIREIPSPMALYNLARSEKKLREVEFLVMEMLFDWINSNGDRLNGVKLFINSAPGSMFSQSDWRHFAGRSELFVSHTILGLDGSDYIGNKNDPKNIMTLRSAGLLVSLTAQSAALDTLEKTSSVIMPDVIKIGKEFTADIDKDPGKLAALAGIKRIAERSGAKILAVGIETAEETDVMLDAGVSYLQGFYIGMPASDLFEPSDEIKSEISKKIKRK